MRPIKLESTLHMGIRYIKLSCDYDFELVRRIKRINGAWWNMHLRCWHLPYTEESLNELGNVKNEVGVDIADFETFKEERKSRYFDKKLSDEKERAIQTFKNYLEIRRYSERTISSYIEAIRTLLGFFKERKLEEITGDAIRAFNSDYILKYHLSWSYQNQIISSMKLFFRFIMKKELPELEIDRPRIRRNLPDIFSISEIEMLLKSIRNIKHKSAIGLIYACGLRRGELIGLRINSIDSKRRLLIVKGAKGNKDRIVPLPESIIILLREYYKMYRPKTWLFEGQRQGFQYSETSLREAFMHGMKEAGIKKKFTLHSLRHSYATHLLENGIDLRFIQELLGHKSSKTTEIYTHVTAKTIERIKSPFENLKL